MSYYKIFIGRFVAGKLYEEIKTNLTERYKQCAAKQALVIVKSQPKRRKTLSIMELHQLRGNLFINSVNNDHSHSKIQYTYKGAEHIRNYKQST